MIQAAIGAGPPTPWGQDPLDLVVLLGREGRPPLREMHTTHAPMRTRIATEPARNHRIERAMGYTTIEIKQEAAKRAAKSSPDRA